MSSTLKIALVAEGITDYVVLKAEVEVLLNDVPPLLALNVSFDPSAAHERVQDGIISRLLAGTRRRKDDRQRPSSRGPPQRRSGELPRSRTGIDLLGRRGPTTPLLYPVAQGAVAYDRVTGYFRSSSLSAAAAGLSHFIARGGTMRLIAGAEFSDEDLTAITEGAPLTDVLARRLLDDPLEGADIVSEHRLETLAWLVREGRLQIKIGVPLDSLGRPCGESRPTVTSTQSTASSRIPKAIAWPSPAQ